jgi:alkylation response protein AidB-like acyl-CoA dehydrogenase
MFWVDMKSPGIEVRPIHQMSGGSDFNEVFCTDLRVKDSQRVGAEGQGWQTALVTLMNERLAIGSSFGPTYRDIFDYAKRVGEQTDTAPMRDPAFRERLADWYVQNAGLRFTKYRTMTALSRGQTPGPEASIGKIITANLSQDLVSTALDMLDELGIVTDPTLAPMHGALAQFFLSAPGMRLAGGTDEILLNVLAERVLGLPSDVRVDKNVAFKDLPGGR